MVKKGLPYNLIKLHRYISPGHIWSKTWLNVGKKWFHDELVKMTDKKWCNKSEVSWQKLPPYKICWATWRFLSWSQTNKTAEKLRVANISGWHHSGAVWNGLLLLLLWRILWLFFFGHFPNLNPPKTHVTNIWYCLFCLMSWDDSVYFAFFLKTNQFFGGKKVGTG